MKTKYIQRSSRTHLFILGALAILLSSCGSYQNTNRDNDGIYGNDSRREVYNEQSNPQNLQYQDYFGSFTDDQEQAETFTDIDNYQSTNNQQEYASGNAGWGGNSENITVNVYGNNWGYGAWNNYWYGSNWGWGNSWGWSPWYGPGWGMGYNNYYNPYYGYGWNSWYSPYYGYPSYYNNYYINNNYSHNQGIRGVRNDMYGRNTSRTISDRSLNSGRRTEIRSTRTDNTIRSTRSTTQPTRRSDANNTTRATVPSRSTTPVRTAPTRSNRYESQPTRTQTQPTRTYNTAPTRSISPSSPVMQSGGSRSSGSTGGRR